MGLRVACSGGLGHPGSRLHLAARQLLRRGWLQANLGRRAIEWRASRSTSCWRSANERCLTLRIPVQRQLRWRGLRLS